MTAQVSNLAQENLGSSENQSNPFPYFAALVAEAPVIFNERHRAWLVSGYEVVESALRNPSIGSDRISPYVSASAGGGEGDLDRMFEILSRWIVFLSPPDHTRLRGLVHKSFTPRRVAALEKRAAEIASELADAMAQKLAATGEVDVVADFCVPYPGQMIAEMFGVPVEDGIRLRRWAEVLGLFINGSPGNPERDRTVAHAMQEFEKYLRVQIEAYRAKPQDNILSGLVVASEDAESLTDTELIATCMLLLDAGYKTVQNALGNAVLTLMQHPAAWARLAAEPDLMPVAVEECLRFMGPGNLIIRRAREDVELAGHLLHADERVYLVPAAANRDPAKFVDPHEFVVDRFNNPHLTFGQGIHFCMGSALARMEMKVGLQVLLARLPRLEPVHSPAALSWHKALILHGVEGLPARVAGGESS